VSNLDLVLAAAVVFFAYFLRGVTGFGSALVAVPLLVQMLPLTTVVPFIATLDVVAALVLTGSGLRGRQVCWSEVWWLLPGSLLGIVVGLQLLECRSRHTADRAGAVGRDIRPAQPARPAR